MNMRTPTANLKKDTKENAPPEKIPYGASAEVRKVRNAVSQHGTMEDTSNKEHSNHGTTNSLHDHCGRCGCERQYHNPPERWPGSKSRRFMGPVQPPQERTLAPTACSSCPHCICFCVAFVEPFHGQPWPNCFYEEKHNVKPKKVLSARTR